MKKVEIIFILLLSFIYIMNDLTNYEYGNLEQDDFLNIETIDTLTQKSVNTVTINILKKNVWNLQVQEKKKEVKIIQTINNRYKVSGDKKSLCIKTDCFELIGIKDSNKAIFYKNKKFISFSLNDKIDENLTLIKIGDNVIIKDKNTTYSLEKGFVDITLYKGIESE